MTEPRGPEDQTTIEDIQSPDWNAAAAPAAVSPPTPAAPQAPAAPSTRRRSGLRWLVALVGVAVVLAASARRRLAGRGPSVHVGGPRLRAGRQRRSTPKLRLDLPGDQRQKLGNFLANFPGFKDQSQLEPKLDEALDRLVRSATNGKPDYTTKIKPWFGGQIVVGIGCPNGQRRRREPASRRRTRRRRRLRVIERRVVARRTAWPWRRSARRPSPADHDDGKLTCDATISGGDHRTRTRRAAARSRSPTRCMLGGTRRCRARRPSTRTARARLADHADVKAALGHDRPRQRRRSAASGPEGLLSDSAARAHASRPSAGAILDQHPDRRHGPRRWLPAWQVTSRCASTATRSRPRARARSCGDRLRPPEPRQHAHRPSLPAEHAVVYAEVHDVGQALTALRSTEVPRPLPETKAALRLARPALAGRRRLGRRVGGSATSRSTSRRGADGHDRRRPPRPAEATATRPSA